MLPAVLQNQMSIPPVFAFHPSVPQLVFDWTALEPDQRALSSTAVSGDVYFLLTPPPAVLLPRAAGNAAAATANGTKQRSS